MSNNEEEYLTVRQTARTLQVHVRTVWRRIQAGTLPATVLPGRSGHEYRIKQSDIEKYLEDCNA